MPSETTSTCWSCGTLFDEKGFDEKGRAQHFCNACGKVQPASPVDYFTFFGFPRKLDLDVAGLEREFYALSRRLHPDVFAQAEEQERAWSLEQSSTLNDAYRALKDPIKRTEYLLRLEGVELEEQSKQATEKARATGELKKQVVPPDLLEEVFELNMHLEEVRAQKKMGEDDPALLEEIGKAKLAGRKVRRAFQRTEERMEKVGRSRRRRNGRGTRKNSQPHGRRAESQKLYPKSGTGRE